MNHSNISHRQRARSEDDEQSIDLQEADQSLLLVFPELRDSLRTTSQTTTEMSAMTSQTASPYYSGVLWKRRDVFKNRWRPRWFSLHPQQGILTYYLLSTPMSGMDDTAGSAAASRSHGRPSMDGSNMSGVSDNSMDYDVVPRGTIFLWGNGGGSSVAIVSNDLLSKPSEHLYAFSIRSSSGNDVVVVHLAARTAAARAEWVTHLTAVCQQHTASAPTRRTLRRLQSSPIGNRPGLQRDTATATIPEQRAVGGSSDADAIATPAVWETVGGAETATASLPDELAQHVNAKLHEYLPLCSEGSSSDDADWKPMFQHNDNDYKAFQRTTDAGRLLVQTHRTLSYTPMQVLAVLADIDRRQDFETNLQSNRRLQILNPHTWFDVYAYRGVWPTSPREFAVVSHWRVVRTSSSSSAKETTTSIVYVSFSCPASDAAAQPVAPKCVRGQVMVSLYLLRSHPKGCRLTRLLSVDLGGGLSAQISNIVASQSAGLPAVLDEYMGKQSDSDDGVAFASERVRTTAIPTNDLILKDIVPLVGKISAALKESIADASTSVNDEQDDEGATTSATIATAARSVVIAPDDNSDGTDTTSTGWEWQAMFLLAPIVMTRCCVPFLVGHGFLFLLLVFLCLRQLALLGNGKQQIATSSGAIESVTCRFTVEPKGILRFVANHQEEREEIDASEPEVKAVHVVVSALAKALRQRKELRRRRLHVPWLCIDRVVDASDEPMTISVLRKGSEEGGHSSMETICGPETLKVREVADRIKASTRYGECLVLPMENEQPAAPPIRLDASSAHPNVTIVACVFGLPISADKQTNTNGSLPFLKGSSPARQQISVALTVRGVFDPFACPALAQEVQKLLQFPEMCDDD